MKKILAMIMAVVILATALTGCTTLKKDADGNIDRGAVIKMYLATKVLNFDPQLPMTDDSMIKFLSLTYEGLTTLNSKGKWENAMMDNYVEMPGDLDGYSIVIELKNTKWTDGRTVQAVDYVYSWKRLLRSDNNGEAAALLYDIKNARDAALGNASIDDVGVSAVDTYKLKVTFNSADVDLDRFFTNASSLALVPLREDCVTRYDRYFASAATSIITCGPFALKAISTDGEIRLERSSYYYRDTEDQKEILDKFVIPYRLSTDYSVGDAAAQLEAYNAEELFYVGDLPLASRAEYAKKAEVSDLMSTHTYFFNTTNPLFEKAEVRRALSLAIDREAIVEILTFAKAAEGVIPEGVFDTGYKSSFRKEAGELIASTANVDEAKSLLSAAGVRGGSFTITTRDNEADVAVAEYVKGVWSELGFTVKVKTTGTDVIKLKDATTGSEFDYTVDEFEDVYASGEWDVIALDMNMLSPDAFGTLAQFAPEFSGNGIDYDVKDANGEYTYPVNTHITGYSNDEYSALILSAFEATDEDEKAELLRQAEKKLVEDMPIMPLVTLQSAYISSKILSGFETTYYGTTDFRRVKMKNYMDYKEAETEAGPETDAE